MAGDSNEAEYRKEQLDFVSGTFGTTARETMLLLLPSVCSLLLMVTITSLVGKYLNYITRYLLEFLVVIVPTVLCYTIYCEEKISICFALLALSGANFIFILIKTKASGICGAKTPLPPARRPFITNFRALTSILTAICILAVDFKAFPRRYAKTWMYGFSLMDTGVGFFVMSNALVSPESRDFGQGPDLGFLKTALKNLRDCVRSCVPLLVLGSARYFSIEYLNYQKQVTEYGVHWNFFITLAAVKIISSIVTSFVRPKYSLLVAIVILAVYEYILNLGAVRRWLVAYSREGFLSANREGIVSTLGNTGLYFVGVAIGRLVHSTYQRSSKAKANQTSETYLCFRLFGRRIEAHYSESMILCVKLSLIAAQACVATLFLNAYFRVSRKFANAGYCAWMVTLTTTMLTILLLLDVITDILRRLIPAENNAKGKQIEKNKGNRVSITPDILEAVNYNGLAFFLVSNLLTGMINMTMRTLYVEDLEAVKIITAYMFTGTALFAVMYRYKIQIKL